MQQSEHSVHHSKHLHSSAPLHIQSEIQRPQKKSPQWIERRDKDSCGWTDPGGERLDSYTRWLRCLELKLKELDNLLQTHGGCGKFRR